MPLNLFYTMVQKSQKWPKTQIKGGSCLKAWLLGQKCIFLTKMTYWSLFIKFNLNRIDGWKLCDKTPSKSCLLVKSP